jgi:hypothetical protein
MFAFSRPHGRACRRPRSVSAAGLVWAMVMVGGVLVWEPPSWAFTGSAESPNYSLASDSVSLHDDDSGTAMFSATNLRPGSSDVRCIVVSAPASLASSVKLYARDYRTTNGLGESLNMVIDEGTGGHFGTSGQGSCNGFTSGGHAFRGTLAAFATSKTSFASGVGGWAPSGSVPVSKTYRFSFNLDSATPNEVQAGTAAIGLTWEQQDS